MSTDFQIGFRCPHLVLEEVVELAPDGRTLTPSAPIASSNTVRILINDEVFVPRVGFSSQAQLYGAFSGPYRIDSCDRNLTVVTSAGSASITLPVGSQVPPSVVSEALSTSGIVTVEVVRGYLILTDAATFGQGSFVKVYGSAAPRLGFEQQYGSNGKLLYPGWGLTPSSDDGSSRGVFFSRRVPGNPIVKVTYVAVPTRCPRCSGKLTENDLRFDTSGDLIIIGGFDLLYQAALKIVLTRLRSNPFHPEYGSSIQSRIGSKAISTTTTLITSDVQTALSTMQTSQLKQSRYQQVSLAERLYSVSSVQVRQDPQDMTAFLVDVVVTSASGDPVALTISYSVPGVTSTSGTIAS